jgi:acetylornithine deacetylase/succinyl-diaminopimelate desuccinylase-like protein
VEILRVTGERIARLIDGLHDAAMHAKPEWAEFSIAANICHLRDIEAEGFNIRARRMREESDPFLPDVNGAKLAAERNYDAQDWRAALREFTALRADTISRIDGEGSGTLEGVGPITLRDLAARMEQHDHGHVNEIGTLAALARFDARRDDYKRDLIELCRIPGVSAADPANVRRSAEATAELLRKCGLQDVQILEAGKAHPAVYGEWRTGFRPSGRGEARPTLLFYAHHDIQPIGDRARWSHDPFDPIERDGRLFARGASDDKAGVVALIAAVASWIDPPCNVKFFIEGEEEIGSPNLDAFLTKYRDLLAADAVVLADSPNFDSGIPALTYRLRGMCQIDVEVRTLERPLHSGRGAGVVPDAVKILCEQLASLRLDESDVALLDDEERRNLESLAFDASRIRKDAGVLDGVELLVDEDVPEHLWTRPAITIIAFEARPIAGAFNQILDSARARLSIRTVPNMDSRAVGEEIVKKLTNACTTARVIAAAPWWRTDAKGPAYDAARCALARGYGRAPVMQGAGGTISFVRNFADAFPGTPLILLGVEDPPCNAHSEDESLSLDDWEKCARSVVHFIAGMSHEA